MSIALLFFFWYKAEQSVTGSGNFAQIRGVVGDDEAQQPPAYAAASAHSIHSAATAGDQYPSRSVLPARRPPASNLNRKRSKRREKQARAQFDFTAQSHREVFVRLCGMRCNGLSDR